MPETDKTAEQLDAEIKAAEAELEARRMAAESVVERLIVSLVPGAQAYFERATANIAVDEHDVTTKLGPKLSSVKQDLKAVAANIGDKVKAWISAEEWPHRPGKLKDDVDISAHNWRADPNGSEGPGRVRTNFDDKLTRLINASMSKHGYRAPHHYGFSWKGEPAAISSEYEQALEEFLGARRLRRNAVTERQRLEARSLWDKA